MATTTIKVGLTARTATADTVTVALPIGRVAADFSAVGATLRAYGTSYPVAVTLTGTTATFPWPAPDARSGREATLQLNSLSVAVDMKIAANSLEIAPGLTPGAVLATLTDPFAGLGLGVTTFAATGTVPDQLTVSGSRVLAGLVSAAYATVYPLTVTATSGDASKTVVTTLNFMAQGVPAKPGSTTATILGNVLTWQAARSMVLSGPGLARINAIGDSTDAGTAPGPVLATGGWKYSAAAILVQQINARYGRADLARCDSFTGARSNMNAANLANFAQYDDRWTIGNLTASDKLAGPGFGVPAASTTPFAYQPRQPDRTILPYDRVRMAYRRYAATTMTIPFTANGGGGTVVLNARAGGGGANSGDLQYATFAVPRGTGPVTFTPDGGTNGASIPVIEVWDSTVGQILVRDMGVIGSKAADWLTPGALTLPAVPADLTIYSFTLNESAAGTTPDQFETNLRALIALGTPGSIGLTVENESSTNNFGGVVAQRALAARIRLMATASNYSLADVPVIFGDYPAATLKGYMLDDGHMTPAGQAARTGLYDTIVGT